MRIIWYLFRKVIPLFFGALFFFTLVLVLVDLMMNLWNFISNGVSGLFVLRILALYVPKCLWYATPIAILFAVSYTLSDFYASNELIAIFASGISLIRFTAPLLVLSFVMSLALFFFEDKIVVPTYARKVSEQESVLKKDKTLNNDKIVILSDGGRICYKAEFYDDSAKRLISLFVILRNEDKSLNSVIRADSAVWRDGRWVLSGGAQYTYRDGEIISGTPDPENVGRLTESPETFQNNVISVETVDSRAARAYVEHLQKAGLPFGEALSLYYKKFSFPFILFIVVFLSVGLSGKTRKNVMLMSLASCIGAAVLFYVTQMITMLMAKFGSISPFMGAWFPVFMFIVIAAVVLRYART